MRRWRGRWLPFTVLVTATVALAALLWAMGNGSVGPWPGRGVTGYGQPGQGPVRTLGDAQSAAQRFADRSGWRVGEVMQFDNGFYAELVDASGAGITEVLIDPGSGAVRVEWGPAMMWNTAVGMHPRRGAVTDIGPDEARRLADRWLQDNRPTEQAGPAEAFPGYYTLHTTRAGKIAGMLSVNASTGTVWYHTWHGAFIDLRENPE